MLDGILTVIILLLITLSSLIVKMWRKNNFVKELYIDKSGILLGITIAVTTLLLTAHFSIPQESLYDWSYLLIVLLFDLLFLFLFCMSATTCIYLRDERLIQKNIFYSKEIAINKETKIIEKIDRKIIRSNGISISISSRSLSGNINDLMNKIRMIIDKQTDF